MLRASREAVFGAAEAAIKARYGAEAKKTPTLAKGKVRSPNSSKANVGKVADVRLLAEAQNKELEELAGQAEQFKSQVSAIGKLNLLSETDYRNLPDELRSFIN